MTTERLSDAQVRGLRAISTGIGKPPPRDVWQRLMRAGLVVVSPTGWCLVLTPAGHQALNDQAERGER